MNEQILINVTPFETRVAIVEQGTVQEIQLERSNQRGNVGNIYLGKVSRVLPGMQSAFIDIGLERAAFIHLADLRENEGILYLLKSDFAFIKNRQYPEGIYLKLKSGLCYQIGDIIVFDQIYLLPKGPMIKDHNIKLHLYEYDL